MMISNELDKTRFNGSETVKTTYDHLSRVLTETTTTIKPVSSTSESQIVDEIVETITYQYDDLGRITQTTTDCAITRKQIPDAKSDEESGPTKPKEPVNLFAEIGVSHFGNIDVIGIGKYRNEEVFDSVKIGDEVNVLLTKRIYTGPTYSVITEKTVLRCIVTNVSINYMYVRPRLYSVTTWFNTSGHTFSWP